MSISGISSITPSADTPSNNPRAALQSLVSSIQSGDLSAAQQAYSALTSNGVPGPLQNSAVGQDLSAVGDALKSGDVSGAQTALDQLRQDLQAAHRAHGHHGHHHHHGGQKSSDTEATAPTGLIDPNDPASLIGTTLKVKA